MYLSKLLPSHLAVCPTELHSTKSTLCFCASAPSAVAQRPSSSRPAVSPPQALPEPSHRAGALCSSCGWSGPRVCLDGAGRQSPQVGPFSAARSSSQQDRAQGLGPDHDSGPRGQTQGFWGQICGSNPTYNLTFGYFHFLYNRKKIVLSSLAH